VEKKLGRKCRSRIKGELFCLLRQVSQLKDQTPTARLTGRKRRKACRIVKSCLLGRWPNERQLAWQKGKKKVDGDGTRYQFQVEHTAASDVAGRKIKMTHKGSRGRREDSKTRKKKAQPLRSLSCLQKKEKDD